uniref:Uncharacterized protein C19orf44 homolog n=1 Tax=Saccoglossus kowalevskii TaxID=10224 RepID=A0ABM0MC73_SACKO|nr:PREDICTED: uncharacterized protein C19orf44 homolog [Saccoglossus kowalevskii]
MSKPQGSHTETIHTERTMSPDSRRADWRRRRTFSKSASYTDDFESMQTDSDVDDLSDSVSYSESYTSFSESRTLTRTATPIKKTTKKGKVDSRDVGIQAEDIMGYHWRKDAGSAVLGPSLGLQYVDPSPIASHVISSDAVEALTSYSPSVLLLNDMLRSQLQITQTFLRNSRQMYNSYVGSIGSQFNYTTIEDTNEFLKQHRRPRLTFEEALRQVKEEMGMENK